MSSVTSQAKQIQIMTPPSRPSRIRSLKFKQQARAGVFNKRSILLVVYAFYIAFILVSTIPYIAEQHTRHELMEDGTHSYHIEFNEDGDDTAHYFDVVRANPSKPGILDLSYDPSTHTLTVNAENLEELRIESESIYKDEANEILSTNYDDDPDYYKQWFIAKNKFTVHIVTDTEMTELVFENVPKPVSVIVDGSEWWKTNLHYVSTDDDVEITEVPVGSYTVIIYFQEGTPIPPIAKFTVSDYVAILGEDIFFDASRSEDEDGEIVDYLWDFGDGTEGSGEIITHSYSQTDTYTVSLTVRDDSDLEDESSRSVYIVISDEDDDQDGVPNQLDPHPFNNFDTDGDGLSDDFEDFYDGDAFTSNPWPLGGDLNKTNKDTDDDGWNDNVEIDKETDPIDASDYPKEAKDGAKEGLSIIQILVIIVIIVVVLIVIVMVIRKRKGGGATEIESPDEMDEKGQLPVGPGLVRPGKREMGPGHGMATKSMKAKPSVSVKKPPAAPRARKRSRAVVVPTTKKVTPTPPPLKKPPLRKPPTKKLAPKPPIKPSIMLDTLEMDSLRKFLPPEKLAAQKTKPVEPLQPPTKPSTGSLIKPKPMAPKASMESLMKPKPPTTLKGQSPVDKTETINKFTQALGIGRAKAQSLYDGGYTTMLQLQNATRNELMEVRGIGPKMADRIIRNIEFLMVKRI